jgi:hypothetical protein
MLSLLFATTLLGCSHETNGPANQPDPNMAPTAPAPSVSPAQNDDRTTIPGATNNTSAIQAARTSGTLPLQTGGMGGSGGMGAMGGMGGGMGGTGGGMGGTGGGMGGTGGMSTRTNR